MASDAGPCPWLLRRACKVVYQAIRVDCWFLAGSRDRQTDLRWGDRMYRFGDFQFDPTEARLLGPNGQIHLGNKAIRVLETLVEQRGHLLSKDTLFASVWDGTTVSESALTSVIKELRRGLGDEPKNARYIQGVYGRGYRFVAEVERDDPSCRAPAPSPVSSPRPSIAVLPFSSFGADHPQHYFSDGMTIEIVTALSRFASLFVISSGTTLSYRKDERSAPNVASELGVRYILQGSVREAAGRVRIAVELIDTPDQVIIWSQSFDRELADVFALQDEVANAVASQIEPSITANEVRGAAARPTQDSSAYDLYLRGMQAFWEGWHADSLVRAIDLYQQSARLDPGFAAAHAMASSALINLIGQGLSKDAAGDMRISVEHARTALRIGSQDAEVLSAAAYTLFLNHEPLAYIDALIEQSFAQNSGISVCYWRAGYIHLYAGRSKSALKALETALQLDPRTPWRASITVGQASALMQLERYAEALPILVSCEPFFPAIASDLRRAQAVCHALMGNLKLARSIPGATQPFTAAEGLRMTYYRDEQIPAHWRETARLIMAADQAGSMSR